MWTFFSLVNINIPYLVSNATKKSLALRACPIIPYLELSYLVLFFFLVEEHEEPLTPNEHSFNV